MPAQVGVRAADLHGMAAMLCPIACTACLRIIFVSNASKMTLDRMTPNLE